MNIAKVQLIRKGVLAVFIVFGVLMYAFADSAYPLGGSIHELIEWAGVVMIVICILGRTWCTLYIGGRKIEQFVTEGPYSVSRNPLYLFSIIGAAGAGAQLGSVTAGLIFGALAWIVFSVVVRGEERLLSERYGDAFEAYVAAVPRFVPDPRQWRDSGMIMVAPPKL